MTKMLQRLIGESILLNWRPAAMLWPVLVDPSQIDQILANPYINARDAITDVSRITIETSNCILDREYCAAHAGFVPGEYVQLTVSDNGCGMDKETLSHIFEPFLTAENADYADGRGSVAFVSVHRSMRLHCSIHANRASASIRAGVFSGPKSVTSNLGKVSDLNERRLSRVSSPKTAKMLAWSITGTSACRQFDRAPQSKSQDATGNGKLIRILKCDCKKNISY